MKEVALKHICYKESSSLKQKELLQNGDHPVYGASGIAGYLNTYHQKKAYIGIVKDGSGIGRVDFYPPQTSLIGTMQYILPKEGFDIRYIGYCLQSLDLSKYKQGAAIPHIYFRDYGERIVKVTEDKGEQQRIVSRLDAAFAHIDEIKANAKEQISEARKLFQRCLAKAMEPKEGWEEKTLKEVCAITSVLVNPIEDKYKTLLHVGGANIVSESGEFIDLKTAEEECLVSGKFLFGKEDVLYNKIRPYLKKVARPNFSGLCSADMYPLRHNDIITKDYLYYVLITKDFTDYAILNSGRAGMPKVNRQTVFAYSFYLPSLSEQQHIVARLDTLSAHVKEMEEINQEIISECDALKQSMLRKVFE